jgi:anti-anti-sigma regulatory factor
MERRQRASRSRSTPMLVRLSDRGAREAAVTARTDDPRRREPTEVTTDGIHVVELSGRVTVLAPPEVDIASVSGLVDAVDLALVDRPSELCLDFSETTFCASDGAYVVADTAARCDALGVSLRVIESPAVRRLLDLLGVTEEAQWRAFACRMLSIRRTG